MSEESVVLLEDCQLVTVEAEPDQSIVVIDREVEVTGEPEVSQVVVASDEESGLFVENMPALDVVTGEDELVVVTVGEGPQGQRGIQGVQGLAGDTSYVHNQGVPSDTWVIPHNLGKYPAVFVEDSLGDDVEGVITHDSQFQLTVTFSAAFSGRAFLN